MDLNKIKNVHFLGIGGIGVSAIARMMHLERKRVDGQDIQESKVVDELRALGIPVAIGQILESIPADTDLVVYSRGLEIYAPDFLASVKERFSQVKLYPEMLEIISKEKYTVAISGAHGKTTTTAMVAHVLIQAKKDPTVVVGSLLSGYDTNFIAGKSEYFVIEADEYHRAFLYLHPSILVINNIDLDHIDYYKDLADVQSAYRELALRLPEAAYIICDPNAPNVAPVITGVSAKVINYKDFLKKRDLKQPGAHMQSNAAVAAAVASILAIPDEMFEKAITGFAGTWRRFEYKGTLPNNVLVYDDYGHHPTEIKATLAGARELFPNRRIIALFQPHMFSRTKALFTEFSESFTNADEVILAPIYFAREHDDGTVSSELLAEAISKHGIKANALSDYSAIVDYVKKNAQPGDVILTIGAGPIYQVGEMLLTEIKK